MEGKRQMPQWPLQDPAWVLGCGFVCVLVAHRPWEQTADSSGRFRSAFILFGGDVRAECDMW